LHPHVSAQFNINKKQLTVKMAVACVIVIGRWVRSVS